ncbi:MAG: hypothetical protein BWY22_02079 [Bacteroidetes bacterium ADurb.Bin217]|nr:MAG: hypothetical protein BWY22_02079 [Bacteroidetes bacterium ADurb.Bin217]
MPTHASAGSGLILTVGFSHTLSVAVLVFLQPGATEPVSSTLTVYKPAPARVSTPEAFIVPLSVVYATVPGAAVT